MKGGTINSQLRCGNILENESTLEVIERLLEKSRLNDRGLREAYTG
jgi:hypothetical protein